MLKLSQLERTLRHEQMLERAAWKAANPDSVTITPQSMRQAVAQCESESPRFCDNCLTEDACNVRGMCAHTLREQNAP